MHPRPAARLAARPAARPAARLAAALCLLAGVAAARGGEMVEYQTPYYVLHTDLPPERAREAAARMTKMAEEYHARTRDFSGTVADRLPFYLYADADEYLDGGGTKGSAGQYDPATRTLMAIAPEIPTGPMAEIAWAVVQHEGFHQFADAVIGGELPIWLNEGLAEYFSEAVYTGDGYVSGLVPQWRLERVRRRFADGDFMPLERFMSMSHADWNGDLRLAHYDQAWTLVHFLAHGDGGRYQKPFGRFVGLLGRGTGWERAWRDSFGDARGLEARWRAYWTTMPDAPSARGYAEATVAALTSGLARATASGQSFASADDYLAAAADRRVEVSDADWLPPRLLAAASAEASRMAAEDGATFALAVAGPRLPPRIVCTLKGGTTLTGTATVRGKRVASVVVK